MTTIRRAAALIATVLATAIFIPEANAVKGSCDHRLEPSGFNQVVLAKANGAVIVDTLWTWDFVGDPTDVDGCDGPIAVMHVRNTTAVTYWAHWQRRRGGWRSRQIPPAANAVLTPGGGPVPAGYTVPEGATGPLQLPAGVATYQDAQAVIITNSSSPPT